MTHSGNTDHWLSTARPEALLRKDLQFVLQSNEQTTVLDADKGGTGVRDRNKEDDDHDNDIIRFGSRVHSGVKAALHHASKSIV